MNLREGEETRCFPGPPPGSWLGSRRRLGAFVTDSVGLSGRWFQDYGPLVVLSQGHGDRLYSPRSECPGIFLTHGADAFRQAANLHDTYGKFPLSGQLFARRGTNRRTAPLNYFMTGLFGVNGAEHRQHRRLLMPSFHRQRLELYAQDMVRITQSVLEGWRDGMTLDIGLEMQSLTMRIATQTLFGEDVGHSETGTGRVLREVLRTSAYWLTAAMPWDIPGLPYHRFLNQVATYEKQMRAIIERKRQAARDDNDVLSMLLAAQDAESGAKLSEEEVLGHVGVLFAAGHETSANALTWTLFLLSQHPKVAADLLDELEGVLRGGVPTPNDLERLPLLERVVKESMRILTPVPWNARVLLAPVELGGFELPENSEVWISIFQTHRSPDLYSQPARFNPARWENLNPSPFEYVPFSAGPRMCIGAGFAMLEIRLILAMLLPRFRFQLDERARIDRSGIIVLSPKHGMPMTIHKQDRGFNQGVSAMRGNVRELVELAA